MANSLLRLASLLMLCWKSLNSLKFTSPWTYLLILSFECLFYKFLDFPKFSSFVVFFILTDGNLSFHLLDLVCGKFYEQLFNYSIKINLTLIKVSSIKEIDGVRKTSLDNKYTIISNNQFVKSWSHLKWRSLLIRPTCIAWMS